MKRPPTTHPRRPSSLSRRVPRSRTEAAVELVRVEFQRARLERELDECRRRSAIATDGLSGSKRRSDVLLARLGRREDE